MLKVLIPQTLICEQTISKYLHIVLFSVFISIKVSSLRESEHITSSKPSWLHLFYYSFHRLAKVFLITNLFRSIVGFLWLRLGSPTPWLQFDASWNIFWSHLLQVLLCQIYWLCNSVLPACLQPSIIFQMAVRVVVRTLSVSRSARKSIFVLFYPLFTLTNAISTSLSGTTSSLRHQLQEFF